MSTHGNISIRNEGHLKETNVWLHAFSSGDTEDAYDMITSLPEWLVARAKLSNELNDPSLGPGWWIRQFCDKTWEYALAPYCEIWKSNLASLICARYANRWCPMSEKEAPWHSVGTPAEIEIVCYGDMFIVSTNNVKKFPTVDVMWNERIRAGLKTLSASEASHVS